MTTQRREGGAPLKPVKFARVPHPHMRQDCIEVVSHARDKDGYVLMRPRDGSGRKQMGAHRLAYMSKHGPNSIPPGWETDHICGHRACVNRSHLRILPRSVHKQITNATRFVDRRDEAWGIWETEGRPKPAVFAKLIGIPPTTARRWIDLWKDEDDEIAAWRAEQEPKAA